MLSEKYNHRFDWERDGDERRPVYIAGPYRVDLIAAEEAAFRLVCDAYEALRLDEGNPAARLDVRSPAGHATGLSGGLATHVL
ncbi:hypothetical protein [Streptomyces lydicus]|uniref:hypothetical protein n=1 Tax=Streptomyces lydicus TaxID=47763 RepID=UPI001F2FCE72|nr:hypothetical protein [Streptomyces lydicus]